MKIVYYTGFFLSYNYIFLCIYLTNPSKSDVLVHIFVRLSYHDGYRLLSLSIDIGIKCLSQGYSHALTSRESNFLYIQTDLSLFE